MRTASGAEVPPPDGVTRRRKEAGQQRLDQFGGLDVAVLGTAVALVGQEIEVDVELGGDALRVKVLGGPEGERVRRFHRHIRHPLPPCHGRLFLLVRLGKGEVQEPEARPDACVFEEHRRFASTRRGDDNSQLSMSQVVLHHRELLGIEAGTCCWQRWHWWMGRWHVLHLQRSMIHSKRWLRLQRQRWRRLCGRRAAQHIDVEV